MQKERKKVLLFSEGVTLSQVVRLVTLGRALDPDAYDVSFACSSFDELVFRGTPFRRIPVHSLDPRAVLKTVKAGRRLYDKKMLLRQVDEDLAIFRDTRPALVVGDFRWSLAVSAKIVGVPHAALINAYWSPHAVRASFPVPDHPVVKLLGEAMTARYFPTALPRVFAHFAEPLNAARRAHGLPPVGSLLEVLTHGDHVLYADPATLVPTPGAPDTHEHLGFVPWAPEAALPPFLNERRDARPVVYATVGSSGLIDTLPLIVEALGRMAVTGVVATAGRRTVARVPGNVHVVDFIPGDLAARLSRLVISNGGSSTSYQALAEGVPVLGLASNLDQFLAMEAVERVGAGRLLRARNATATSIREAAEALLCSSSHHTAARRVRKDIMETSSSADRFRAFVARVTTRRGAPDRIGASPPSRAVLRGLSILALLISVLSASMAQAEGDARSAAATPAAGEIRFTSRVPGSGGRVVCALFRESGWLKVPFRVEKALIRSHEATCVFAAVPTGTYGIVAFHDANDNGDIDTNFIGIPTEDWCTSRNARAIFGPPGFGAARFLSRGNIVRLSGEM